MALYDDLWTRLQQAGSWAGNNPLGALAGGMDLFKLFSTINNIVQNQNALQQWKSLQGQGPRVQDYYHPMTDVEQQAYTRGIAANAQQNIPPQSAAFSDLLGTSLASRESQRYQDAYRQAFADWQQRMGARGNIYGTTGDQMGGAPGQNLMQYLLLQQLRNAQPQATGQTADLSRVGQTMFDPYAYGSPEGTFTGQGMPPRTGASPFASGQFTDTTASNPSYFPDTP